jgi:pimeloyl-ACP methyl ester carboxylesterase
MLFALIILFVGPQAAFAQTIPGLAERVVDVGGHRMQVWIGGPAPSAGGPPLVIFENGWNSTAGSWSRVVADVAKLAPVLLYNRGGNGKSEWENYRRQSTSPGAFAHCSRCSLWHHPIYLSDIHGADL